MSEIEDALRSCMEKLLRVREEKEQILIEASAKISSEQKKARDLQHKLEDAHKRLAKLATENYGLCEAVAAKDELIQELKASKALSDEKLTNAGARLESSQKQCASLQYEVRMLQKELEIRNKERDYDLKSVDAAHRQQAENVKKIAKLEAECQRLRAMIRKRLPGPAALAKMKDEVEHPGESRTRRPRSSSPLSPRPSTPRDFASENYFLKSRAIEDENKHLRQVLAKKDSELQFVQMRYADEACKLAVVQRQLEELLGQQQQQRDAIGSRSESWASALVSELEHFKAGKLQESNLLDDLVEIEKMEIASSNQAIRPPSTVTCHCVPDAPAKDTDSEAVVSEAISRDLIADDSVSDSYPEWLQDVLKLIMHRHQVSGISIDAILEEVTHALRRSDNHDKGRASNVSYDQSEIDRIVTELLERVNGIIERSVENNAASSRSFFCEKSEFTSCLERLVHVCGDVLDGKANIEKFIDEVFLILEWMMNQRFSPTDGHESPDIVENIAKSFDADEPLMSTLNVHEEHATQSATSPPTVLGAEPAAEIEPIESTESQVPSDTLENHTKSQIATSELDEELANVTLDQGDSSCQERQLVAHCEIESPAAEGSTEEPAEQEEEQLRTNSVISAATEKLAECQETITNLSKQLQALSNPRNADASETEMSKPRPSTAKPDYMPQSLARILAEEDDKSEDSVAPAPEASTCKKEHGVPDADKDLDNDNDDSKQIIVHPMFQNSPQVAVPTDPKKKKRGSSLLSRLIFRRKAEGS